MLFFLKTKKKVRFVDIQLFLENFSRTDALSREMGIQVSKVSPEGAEAEMYITDKQKNYMVQLMKK